MSIIFDLIFMLQHFVWYKETSHQRIVVQPGKSSELSSPLTKDSGKDNPIQSEIEPKELEAQRNNAEPIDHIVVPE